MHDPLNQHSPVLSRSQRTPAVGNGNVMVFALGAVVGAGIALLLAPENGRQTRERLAASAKRWGRRAGEQLDHAREAATELGAEAKSAIKAGKDAFMQDLGTRESRAERRMAKAGDASAMVAPKFPPGEDVVR